MANLYQLWEEHRARFVHEHKEQRVGDFTIVPNIKNLTWEHVPQPIQKEFEVWLNRQGIHSEETKERSKAVLFGPSEKLPHPLNIYTGFYTQIEKLTGDLPAFLREMKHIKLKSEGFMDLVIESIGNNRISMAHYYEQEHDLMADPEMEIEILTDQKTAEPLTYKQDGLGIYNVVYQYDDKGKKTHVDAKMKTELRNFFRKWLQNIKMQGFKRPTEPGQQTPSSNATGRPWREVMQDMKEAKGGDWIRFAKEGDFLPPEHVQLKVGRFLDMRYGKGGWRTYGGIKYQGSEFAYLVSLGRMVKEPSMIEADYFGGEHFKADKEVWIWFDAGGSFLREEPALDMSLGVKQNPGQKAKLTPEEDKAWIFAFEHYRAEGHSDSEADKLAWRDIVKEFPRLKEFSGTEAEPTTSEHGKGHAYSYTKRSTVHPELAKAMRKLADMERDHPPDSDALRVQKVLVKNLRDKHGEEEIEKDPGGTTFGRDVRKGDLIAGVPLGSNMAVEAEVVHGYTDDYGRQVFVVEWKEGYTTMSAEIPMDRVQRWTKKEENREEEPFSEEVAEDILRQSLGEGIDGVVEHIKHAISYLSTAHGILSDLMHQVPDHPLMKKFLDLEHDLEETVTNLALYVED